MAMVKNENYITIQGFMVSKLGLSGASLIIYAVIYGFSQDDGSYFQGSRQYLAEWCGCSISGVKKCLKQLREMGLIEQVHHSKDNREVYYKANLEPRTLSALGHKVTEPRAQSDRVQGHKVTEPRAQSDQAIDNIADNIEDKLADKIAEEENKQNINVVSSAREPSKKEVFDYIREHCPHINPEGFYKYYERSGWMQNGEPIKNWRRLAITWEENMVAEVEESERMPLADEVKMWAEYEKRFGKKVDPYYYGRRQKYVKLALATDTPLPERGPVT